MSTLRGTSTLRYCVAVLALALAASFALPGRASAGTVLNRFQRSCYWTCSAFVQTNGAYVGWYGSACVTYRWWGSSTYYVGPWQRC